MNDERSATPPADDRLAPARRVAAGLLHEARNVLNPIVSAAFLLKASADDPAKVRELADRIERFAQGEARIAAKMRELLDRETAGEAAGKTETGVSAQTHSSSRQA